jgi:multiple sugar transport system substrate-binding protein
MLFPCLVIFSLLLAACGAPSGAGTSTTGASQAASDAGTSDAAPAASAAAATSGDQIELRMAWWGSQARHDRTLKVIDLFQQEHPNIKITSEYGNFDDHWTKLATQASGGNLPDIIQQDYSKLEEWVSRGQLLALDSYVQGGQLNLSGVAEEQLSGGKIDDKLYGVSLGTNALTVLYDPALFQQAGVETPKADWTWSDFQQAATQIHEKLGIYGVEGFYNAEFLKLWLKEHGEWIYNEDGAGLGYDDDKLAADFFQILLDMQESGAMPSREFDASRGVVGLEDSLIVTKQAAMLLLWSNQTAAVSAAAPDRDLALTQTPSAQPGVEGIYLKPSMFFSVAATSQHPAEAAMFIDYFLNSEAANEVLAAERGVPIAPTVRQALQPSLPAIQQKIFDYISQIEPTAAPIDPPDPPTHGKLISDVYNPLIDQLLYKQITPQEAAAQFREQATAVLASQ